jgi:hypothetical protein
MNEGGSSAAGFARLTRQGFAGPESVYVNPMSVTWVETTRAPAGTGDLGTTIYLVGQPMAPLLVSEPVETVLAALDGARSSR